MTPGGRGICEHYLVCSLIRLVLLHLKHMFRLPNFLQYSECNVTGPTCHIYVHLTREWVQRLYKPVFATDGSVSHPQPNLTCNLLILPSPMHEEAHKVVHDVIRCRNFVENILH